MCTQPVGGFARPRENGAIGRDCSDPTLAKVHHPPRGIQHGFRALAGGGRRAEERREPDQLAFVRAGKVVCLGLSVG